VAYYALLSGKSQHGSNQNRLSVRGLMGLEPFPFFGVDRLWGLEEDVIAPVIAASHMPTYQSSMWLVRKSLICSLWSGRTRSELSMRFPDLAIFGLILLFTERSHRRKGACHSRRKWRCLPEGSSITTNSTKISEPMETLTFFLCMLKIYQAGRNFLLAYFRPRRSIAAFLNENLFCNRVYSIKRGRFRR
jgi:hypothetical protein